jgi:hypothetical protein
LADFCLTSIPGDLRCRDNDKKSLIWIWEKTLASLADFCKFGCVKNLFVIGDQNNNNNNGFGFDSGFGELEENWRS